MELTPDELIRRLLDLTADQPPRRWIVAYSGGLDSSVLLHALATGSDGRDRLAIHVNHGLAPEAGDWQRHCEQTAQRLCVPILCLTVTVDSLHPGGPEAAARDARYRAIADHVGGGDCVLSAHHLDDQAETLLLNLLRGSGPAGLAGAARRMPFGAGILARPFLDLGRAELQRYAERSGLAWIDDTSNANLRFDRNFLRHRIFPALLGRWPAAAQRFGQSAALLGEASELLDALADADIDGCGSPQRLAVECLSGLGAPRCRNVLRRAIRRLGLPSIPAARLAEVVDSVLPARVDAEPVVRWAGAEVRRFRGELFIQPELAPPPPPVTERLYPGGRGVVLGAGLGSLALIRTAGTGIAGERVAGGLSVRFRAGGESLRVARGGHRRTLKNLMQEAGILPWMRDRIPLLFAGDELVAVGDEWQAADAQSEPGYRVLWTGKPEFR